MSDADKTRKFSIADKDIEKTRLVRRAEIDHDLIQPQKQNEVKTRLAGRPLGDVEAQSTDEQPDRLVAGWLVVVKGPGRGSFAAIYDGKNSIGRDDEESTPVNFGDTTISRSGHAYITYDYMQRRFFIQDGGNSNLVRVNNNAVLQATEIKTGDRLLIGSTIFGFVGFCGENFDWQET